MIHVSVIHLVRFLVVICSNNCIFLISRLVRVFIAQRLVHGTLVTNMADYQFRRIRQQSRTGPKLHPCLHRGKTFKFHSAVVELNRATAERTWLVTIGHEGGTLPAGEMMRSRKANAPLFLTPILPRRKLSNPLHTPDHDMICRFGCFAVKAASSSVEGLLGTALPVDASECL